MTYGLLTKGEFNQMIFSTETYTQVFIGKATYVNTQGYANYGPYYATIPDFGIMYNWPVAAIVQYTFNSGGRDAIFYTYTPYPGKSAIISASRSGNIYTIFIASQPAGPLSVIPEVYCFARTAVTTPSGYGMTLYKQDGTIAMTTQDKLLLNKYIYQFNSPASNLVTASVGFLGYVGNSGSSSTITQQIVSPLAGANQTISKPILHFASSQLATRRNTNVGSTYLYELCASFNPTTKNAHLEWVSVTFTSTNIANSAVPARNSLVMVADGAEYD
jgi:hypothetical protein